jgi:hypothetical protein
MQWKIDNLFNKCCRENRISAYRNLKLDPCLSPCTSMSSKWIKDIHTDCSYRCETLKLVQERAGNTQEFMGIDNDSISRTQMDQQPRERLDNWDYLKIKNFCTIKEMVLKLKMPLTERKSWPPIYLIRI